MLALIDFGLAINVRTVFLREPTLKRILGRGGNPEHWVAMVGMVLMLAPVCWALIASFVGLSTAQVGYYAAASTVGLAAWGWRYRGTIFDA
jgi:hypothetical protein